jgi:RNA recognition motif-containing protein
MTNLYVGNLPFQITEEELQQAFARFGDVASAKIIMDRETGRSRGFGFVTMPNRDQAEAAIKGMDGAALKGRNVRVNEARERTEGGGGGGGFRNDRGPRGGGGGMGYPMRRGRSFGQGGDRGGYQD